MTDAYYQLSLNILKALGGDTSVPYPDADAIWTEINKIYDYAGGRFDIVPLEKTITENGQYDYYPENDADAFMPVNIKVDIAQKYTDEQVQDIMNESYNSGYETGVGEGYENGYTEGNVAGKETGYQEGYTSGYTEGETTGYQSGYTEGQTTGYTSGYDKGIADGYVQGETAGYSDGYSEGLEDGAEDQKALMKSVEFVDNGTYTREDGWNEVFVNVPPKGIPEEDVNNMINDAHNMGVETGMWMQKEKLASTTFSSNGTYTREDGWNEITVAVTGSGSKPKIFNGFRFTGGDLSKVDFSQYDWSGVYDCSYLLADCDLTNMDWEHFKSNFNGRILAADYMLSTESSSNANKKYLYTLPNLGEMTKDCLSLKYLCNNKQHMTDASNIQYWNTSSVINTYGMFYNCYQLTTVPQFDTSNVTNMGSMFNRCSVLPSIPQFNTSNVVNMSNMFYYCSALTTVPQFDTSNVTNMSNMFYYCSALTEIPQFDTSNVTDMSSMFRSCTKLTSIPQLDTSKVTNMSQMFEGCSALTEIPQFDTSNVTNMYYMLRNCSALTEIPQFDTSNVTNMQYMLYYCSALTEIPQLDTSKVTNMSYMLTGCKALTTLGGFINMGMESSFTAPDLSTSTNLTKESIMNVINNLYDRKSAGYSTRTLTFGSTNLAKITDEEKAIATSKGWTLS